MADTLKLQALLTAISQLAPAVNTALNTRVAPNSFRLEGRTTEEIRVLFASATQEDLNTLQGIVNDFIARRDNPHAVTKAQVGLDQVPNFPAASNEEGIAGTAADRTMTALATRRALDAFWADQVGSAPDTLNTIGEISAALNNNPDVVDQLLTATGENRRLLDELAASSAADLATARTDLMAYSDNSDTAQDNAMSALFDELAGGIEARTYVPAPAPAPAPGA